MKWNTTITKVEPNHLLTKGYRQEDLIGNIPFSHTVYLLLKGDLPSKEHGKMMDAILTACIDHGVTPPSSIASRVVASGGVPLPTAVAAGVLSWERCPGNRRTSSPATCLNKLGRDDPHR